MDIYYITDIIYLKGNKLYSNNKLIKPTEWHRILCDIGWGKLPVTWIKKLNKIEYHKNSPYGCLDCGSDGDCFFHCISEAMNSENIHSNRGEYYTSESLRLKLSKHMTDKKFKNIISLYRIMKDVNDFDENWDPYSVNNLSEFKDIIMQKSYWCDNILLNEIINIFHINIIILVSDSIQKRYHYYNIFHEYNPKYKSIILLYVDNNHFLLVGKYINNNMIVYFDDYTLPKEIYSIIL
jgi:hypothetical protein